MRRFGFSKEVLSLFFILSSALLFGKVLVDIKGVINLKISQLAPQPTISVEYQATSIKSDDVFEKLPELNVIRSFEKLEEFRKKLSSDKIKMDWLNKKIKEYKEEDLNDKTIVILAIKNNDNVLTTRITGVTKKSNDITITLTRTGRNKNYENQYTWFAIIELKDVDSQILLNIN